MYTHKHAQSSSIENWAVTCCDYFLAQLEVYNNNNNNNNNNNSNDYEAGIPRKVHVIQVH